MSSTATQEILKDYQIHHSNGDIPRAVQQPYDSRNRAVITQRPWDTVHRRVPHYRPINRTRDQAEFRTYTSNVERAFISVMFTGVWINSAASKIWRASGGRINDGIFKITLGGEA